MARKLVILLLAAAAVVVSQPGNAQRKAAPKKGAAAPATPKAAAPQPKPDPAQPPTFPIEQVRVEGSKLYAEDKLIAIAGLKTGAPGLPKSFEEARDRLVASGAFASVAYRYEPGPAKGYVVTFEVADIDQVLPVRFDRLPASDAELRAHLRSTLPLFGDRIPGTKETVEIARRAVEQFLKSKGHAEAVQARVMSERPGDLYIAFHPAGAPPVVAEVRFQGNSVIPSTVLQNTIHGVAIGVEYREARFRELLDNSIRPLYEQRGRVGVKFPKVESAPSQGVKGLKVTVEVEEGESYSFGGLKVAGTQSLNEELVKVADIKVGDLANMDQVRLAQERIHAAMRRGGYMRVTSNTERAVDDRKKTVDVTVLVTPGPEYKFGKLEVQGVDLHGAHEIKRIWAMQPGKVFNADYPQFFLNRIREDGLFDNLGDARAVLAPNDKDLTVDVTLILVAPKQEKQGKKDTDRRVPF